MYEYIVERCYSFKKMKTIIEENSKRGWRVISFVANGAYVICFEKKKEESIY